jgi:uncharacterized protein YaaQ
MKLCVCIVQDRDRNRLHDELVSAGYKFTVIGSTGGFLREGNTTFMVGCPAEDLTNLTEIIRQNSSARDQIVNVAPFEASPAGAFMPSPVSVKVGGAVVFVLPVEEFHRF